MSTLINVTTVEEYLREISDHMDEYGVKTMKTYMNADNYEEIAAGYLTRRHKDTLKEYLRNGEISKVVSTLKNISDEYSDLNESVKYEKLVFVKSNARFHELYTGELQYNRVVVSDEMLYNHIHEWWDSIYYNDPAVTYIRTICTIYLNKTEDDEPKKLSLKSKILQKIHTALTA